MHHHDKPIEFVHMEPIQVNELFEDSFSYNPSKGWKWLQKICFWVLRKIDCRHYEMRTYHRRIYWESSDVIEYIRKQVVSLNSRAFNSLLLDKEPFIILMGSDDFKEAVNCKRGWSDAYMHFKLQFKLGYVDSRDTPSNPSGLPKPQTYIYYMPVYVIPHMKGVIVLPSNFAYLCSRGTPVCTDDVPPSGWPD